MKPTPEELIAKLGLEPHQEGGCTVSPGYEAQHFTHDMMGLQGLLR